MAEALIDEIGESPEWRSKPEYAYLVNDIGRVCETINKLLGQRDWPLSESTDVKRVARNTCALAKQTSNTVRQEARRKTVQFQKPKDTPPPRSPTDSAAPVTRVVIESRPQLPDIAGLTDASSMLSSLPDTETDAQSMSPREDLDDDTSSTRPLLNYPDLPVV
ncbi:hypothetical protein OH76DRAFT_1397208 [Lentinus brumalis]|uniref:Uncharacterized protein n=1 Tax=Lentinus brumalis TaxID=2498619 RepID=A0A371DQY1_9APHY|nr:hypothetical protein OH76DRAFT_1397208 [Polyporus brumalis]